MISIKKTPFSYFLHNVAYVHLRVSVQEYEGKILDTGS